MTEYVGSVDVSEIVTVELVATIVPDVDPVLICILKLSEPSVETSLVKVLTIDPLLLLIVNEPEVTPSVKSEEFTVPLITLVVQYNVVPLGTPAVVTVNVTDDPSFTVEVDGETEYVGTEVSLIVTVLLFATIVPDVLPVRRLSLNCSVPSSDRSFDSV